ncbi:hypothetical protein KP509_11G078900 [Ceratopteris richardii]|nr:hypothetical protein KP509_11G078900 [Ceratopteris richardii]
MPAWPKKCGHEASNANVDADESTSDDDDEADENNYDDSSDDDYRSGRRGRLAPHEIVDREYARSTTFSVIEGAGRTLKGSDLRRVRNAVWSCTGFED